MFVTITLPDGAKRHYENAVTAFLVAQEISPRLAEATLAAKADDKLIDLHTPLQHDVTLTLITDKSPEALEIIRHSTAHLLAQAVKQLFPQAQVTIGPVIENGFYYDFAFERTFTPDDLIRIEEKMTELA